MDEMTFNSADLHTAALWAWLLSFRCGPVAEMTGGADWSVQEAWCLAENVRGENCERNEAVFVIIDDSFEVALLKRTYDDGTFEDGDKIEELGTFGSIFDFDAAMAKRLENAILSNEV